MKQVKTECNFDLWYLLYADDLVFVASYHQIEIILDALLKVSALFKLLVSPKKCGIINIRNNDKLEGMDLHGIPLVE